MTTSIAFLINWNKQLINQNLLTLINQCVRHHCLDGEMIWMDNNVAMTQADLVTLPQDKAGIHVFKDNLHIVASCRIDNREEIIKDLPPQYLPKSNTDSALILAAYEFYGDNFVEQLIGDFAFIIWDENQEKVLAGRDISGTRQLYYYNDHNKLIIASDRTQIFQDSTIDLKVDESQIIEYLTPSFQFSSGWNLGFFQGVKALPAGYILTAKNGLINIRKYWQYVETNQEKKSDADYLNEYLSILTEAVRCRLRTNSKVGVELSGGFDSPAIACLAAQLSQRNNKQLHSFSMVFPKVPEVDESEQIKKVVQSQSLTPHYLEADDLYKPQFLKPHWKQLSIMSPHELLGGSFFELYDLALDNEVKVMLTGLMGDDLNYGSDRLYYELFREQKWGEVWRRIKFEGEYSIKNACSKLILDGLLPFTPLPFFNLSLLLREVRRSYHSFAKLPDYFTPQLKQKIFSAEQKIRLERIRNNKYRSFVVRETLNNIFPPFVMLTMAFPQGIERRHPYSDRRLIEFVLSLPVSLKWEENKIGYNEAGRFHHRQVLEKMAQNSLFTNNKKVEFSPVLKHFFPPDEILNWFKSSKTIYIFEQNYVIPDLFLAEIYTRKNSLIYLLSLLSLESWFRFLFK